MNKTVLMTPVTIHSKRFDRDLDFEGYTGDNNIMVISKKSLFRVFEPFKREFGIKIKKNCEQISYTSDGVTPAYCLCKCTITDKDGYDCDFMGESTPQTRESSISKNNPFKTAENRAEACAIIRYLDLPDNTYSDVEIEEGRKETAKDVQRVLEEGTVKIVEKKEREKNTSEKSKESEDKEGFVSAPIESTMNSNAIKDENSKAEENKEVSETSSETSKEHEKEEVHEDNEKQETVKSENISEESKKETEEETKNADDVEDKENTESSENPEDSKVSESESTSSESPKISGENLDLIVNFGAAKGKNLTVKEVLLDDSCKNMVSNIRSGKLILPVDDTEKAKVLIAIRDAKIE